MDLPSNVSFAFGEAIRPAMENLIGNPLPDNGQYFALHRADTDGVGYIGFGQYDGYNAYIYIACEGRYPPMRLGWAAALDYAFRVAKCTRITSKVDASNTKAIRMNRLFGLTEEGLIRKGNPYSREDVFIFGFTDDDYKLYLEKKHGKERRHSGVRTA